MIVQGIESACTSATGCCDLSEAFSFQLALLRKRPIKHKKSTRKPQEKEEKLALQNRNSNKSTNPLNVPFNYKTIPEASDSCNA